MYVRTIDYQYHFTSSFRREIRDIDYQNQGKDERNGEKGGAEAELHLGHSLSFAVMDQTQINR